MTHVRRVSRRLLWIAAPALALSGCGGWLGLPEAGTRQAESISTTWRVFTIAAVVVGGLTLGLILYAVVRFRSRSEDLPPQVRYNVPIEVLYTVVPILLVIALFFVSAWAISDVERPVEPAVTIEATAFQWGWTFDYPDLGITVSSGVAPPEILLPVDESTRFVLRSDDVVHSFFVPGFLYKHDMIPGEVFTVDVEPTSVGTFSGKCAEFCGLFHHRMTFTVDVVDRATFDRWVAAGGATQ